MDRASLVKALEDLEPGTMIHEIFSKELAKEDRLIEENERRENQQRDNFYKYQTYRTWVGSEGGKKISAGVNVWESGRDCDGVKYGGTSWINAKTYKEYEAELEEAYSWADGPKGFSIIADYEVEEAQSQSYSIDTFAAAAGY